jgi:hypothetical protein
MNKNRKISETTAVAVLMMGCVLAAIGHGQAQTPKQSYPTMAPLSQYLMTDRNAEIQLAKSAAPPAISDHAEVLVLGQHGYETAVPGSNGFVCVVERSWMSAFDDPQFWNYKLRGPLCFNPASARTVLPLTYKRTKLVLAGASKAQIIASIKETFDKKEVPPLEVGAMSYMMSRHSYLGDGIGHGPAHLMFYAPKTNGTPWGEDLPNSPVFLNRQFNDSPEPFRTYIVAVSNWSDGTPASTGEHQH